MVLGGPTFTDITGIGVASEQTFVGLESERNAKNRRFSPQISPDYQKVLQNDERFAGNVTINEVPWYSVNDYITWNGFKIYISKVNETVGNRLQTHVYQNTVNPYTQRLGRKARRWSFNGFLIGYNSRSDKEILKQAIETGVVGETHFPSVGLPVQTYIESASFNEALGKNLLIEISVTFVEAGAQPQLPFANPNINIPATLVVTEVVEATNNILEHAEEGIIKFDNEVLDNELYDYALIGLTGFTGIEEYDHTIFGCEDVERDSQNRIIRVRKCDNGYDLSEQHGAGFTQLEDFLYGENGGGDLHNMGWDTIMFNLVEASSSVSAELVQAITGDANAVATRTVYDRVFSYVGQTESVTEINSQTELGQRISNGVHVVNRVGEILLTIAVRKLVDEVTGGIAGISETIRRHEIDLVFREGTDEGDAVGEGEAFDVLENPVLTEEAARNVRKQIIDAKRSYFERLINGAFRAVYNGEVYGQGNIPPFIAQDDSMRLLHNRALNFLEETLTSLLIPSNFNSDEPERRDENFRNLTILNTEFVY